MTTLNYDKEVVGDLHAAYALLRMMSEEDLDGETGKPPPFPSAAPSAEDRESLLRGLGTIICSYMRLFDPGGLLQFRQDEFGPPADALHVVVPAIASKVAKALPGAPDAMPILNGALVSAALGEDCYEWRVDQGPWDAGSIVAWALAAWHLSDLVDFTIIEAGRGTEGFALQLIADMIDRPGRTLKRRGRRPFRRGLSRPWQE